MGTIRETVQMWLFLVAAVFQNIASEYSTKALCRNCKEPGHMASNCPNDGICHACGKAGHLARDCSAPQLPPSTLGFVTSATNKGIAADCTNEKACNNCRKTGHLARGSPNEPVCIFATFLVMLLGNGRIQRCSVIALVVNSEVD